LPKTYEDLLDPEVAGRDLLARGSEVGAGLFIASRCSMGKEKGEAYRRRRRSGSSTTRERTRASSTVLASGEYKLALHIYAHHPLISKAKGAPLDVQMLEPVPRW
jgi:ABC-type Fe3+ transport system substrate-binding protein